MNDIKQNDFIFKTFLRLKVLNMLTRKRKYLELGREAYDKGNDLKAIEYYEKSLFPSAKGTPVQYVKAFLYLGDLYYRNEEYSKALNAYENYLKQRFEFAPAGTVGIELGVSDDTDYIAQVMYRLGKMYYFGHGTQENNQKAREYFEKVLALGNSDPLFYLGQIYYCGHGIEPDYIKAKDYFEKVLSCGDNNSSYYLGMMYYLGRGIQIDYAIAMEHFKKVSKFDRDSALMIGKMYYFGNGVPVNYTKAEKYYDQAARLGSTEVFYYLGYLYYSEHGLKIDYIKAKEYFEKGANSKCSDSMVMLGVMYNFGEGVEEDCIKAGKYYDEAAELENADAIYHIGCTYREIGRLRSDFTQANLYFARAAALGHPKGINDLGVFYHEKRRYKKAKTLYEISAKLNEPLAMINLANLLVSNKNPDRANPDMQKAIVLYVEAYQKSGDETSLQKIHNLLDYDPNLSAHVFEYIRSYQKTSIPEENTRIQELQMQMIYRPGGCGYVEAKEEFEKSTVIKQLYR